MDQSDQAFTSSVVLDGVALARVHDLLMAPNFPVDELVSVEDLIGGVLAGVAEVRVVGPVDDPVAVAVVETLEATPAVLLAYFATREDLRGRGVGSALLKEVLRGIATDTPDAVVLAEVEHPGFHPAHPMHGDPDKRLRFYLRLGGSILDVPYFQPPVDEGQEPVYGMLLLALDPPPHLVRAGRLAPEAGLLAALESIMAAADPARHPVATVVRAAAMPDGVRLLGLDDVAQAPVLLGP